MKKLLVENEKNPIKKEKNTRITGDYSEIRQIICSKKNNFL